MCVSVFVVRADLQNYMFDLYQKIVRVDDDATPPPPGAGAASVCPVDRARKLQRRVAGLVRAGRQRQRQKPIDICCRRQSVVASDAVIRDTVINTHLFVTDV